MNGIGTAAILTCVLLLTGCGGGNTGGATLEIQENGTYDVSGYSQVIVDVDGGGNAEETTGAAQGNGTDSSASDQGLSLKRVQLKDFSIELPSEFVEGYTEAELTENSNYTFFAHDVPDGATAYSPTTMSIDSTNMGGSSLTLESLNDGPQEEVNGLTMAVKHSHGAINRMIKVSFIHNGVSYSVNFSYMTDLDAKYGKYAEEFYRTIQMN